MAPRRRHVGIAEHPRDLFYPQLTLHNLHITRRDAAFLALCHHQLLVGVDGDLREVRDDQRLAPFPRHVHQRLPDAAAHFPTDSLIDFVEHESRDNIVRREHDLERQHEARQLTT